MKRFILITIAFVLAVFPALADIGQLIDEYNLHDSVTSAKPITGTPEESMDSKGRISYDCKVTENIIVRITVVEDQARVFAVLCLDESEVAEFFAQCANCIIQIDGYSAWYYCASDLLDLFLQARAGEKTENRKLESAGLVYTLSKESFGYVFMIAR